MPFWQGDRAGPSRSSSACAIGELDARAARLPPRPRPSSASTSEHDLDARAAENLLQYLESRTPPPARVPDDRTIVIERCRDELGDWRVCVLSPFGGRVHAPWAMAAAAQIREETGVDVETLWSDDGFVVRFPDVDAAAGSARCCCPTRTRCERARRAAARVDGALRRASSARRRRARCSCRGAGPACARRCGSSASAPPICWRSRRATDRSRCCSRPTASACATSSTCRRSSDTLRRRAQPHDPRRAPSTRRRRRRSPRRCSSATSPTSSTTATRRSPSGARRRSSVDQAQLRELLGDAELRELLDADAIDEVERQLQRLDPTLPRADAPTALHDLLLRLGDLTRDETRRAQRHAGVAGARRRAGRARGARSRCAIAGEPRFIAVEDAARYRDALGVAAAARPARGAPRAGRAIRCGDLGAALRAHARAVHGRATLAARFGFARGAPKRRWRRLRRPRARCSKASSARAARDREWCDAGRAATRPAAVARASCAARSSRSTHAALGRFVDDLAGRREAPRRASTRCSTRSSSSRARRSPRRSSRREILPGAHRRLSTRRSRRPAWRPAKWRGSASSRSANATGASRCTSPITCRAAAAAPTRSAEVARRPHATRAAAIVDCLARAWRVVLRAAARGRRRRLSRRNGRRAVGARLAGARHQRHAPRAARVHATPRATRARAKRRDRAAFRSRRLAPPSAEGRWSLVGAPRRPTRPTDRVGAAIGAAAARAARRRHARGGRGRGVAGRIRRGLPGAEGDGGDAAASAAATSSPASAPRSSRCPARSTCCDRCATSRRSRRSVGARRDRSGQSVRRHAEVARLRRWRGCGAQADDSAAVTSAGRGPTRSVGATVILVDGALAAYLARAIASSLPIFPIPAGPDPSDRRSGARWRARSSNARERAATSPRGMLIEEIDGAAGRAHARAVSRRSRIHRRAMGFQATFRRT